MNSNFIPKNDIETARQTIIEWPELVKSVVDGYRSNGKGIVHGVQKDAIQNAWGARKDKKGAQWICTFNYLQGSDNSYFVIEDHGTYGLTGRVLDRDEYLEDLPSEERWGRFESLAFNKGQSRDILGSRGRGKLIFVGASKDKTILYDTLRDDGVYRFGFRTVNRTGSPVNSFEGQGGTTKLKQYTKNLLSPINHIGTRVIIVNPIDELVEEYHNGKLLEYIEETWWEIIRKYDATITVIRDREGTRAEDPYIFQKKEGWEPKIWRNKLKTLKVGRRKYRVKEFFAACDKDRSVPKALRGISIQRGGMKIMSLPMDYAPKEIAEGLYGYVTFDKNLDEEMLKEEGVEHYSYDFRKTVPQAVNHYIQDELEAFGREKLGVGVDAKRKKHEERTAAQKEALAALNKIAGTIGLFKSGPGPKTPTPPSPPKPFKARLIMPYFVFPNEDNRVNYGQRIEGISLDVESRIDIRAAVKLYIYYDQGIGSSTIKNLLEQDITLKKGKYKLFGPFTERVEKIIYLNKGKYFFKARLISLEKNTKGDILDEVSRSFYVEQDPPNNKGVFEDFIPKKFDPEINHLMSYLNAGSRKSTYKLAYNISHQEYKRNMENQAYYLYRLGASHLPYIDLRENPNDPILFNIPSTGELTAEAAAEQIPEIIGRLLGEYYN